MFFAGYGTPIPEGFPYGYDVHGATEGVSLLHLSVVPPLSTCTPPKPPAAAAYSCSTPPRWPRW